jgi:predicted KAP-like P-loop ATPase
MFLPDRPIVSCTRDTLGRRAFSQAVGNAILHYPGTDSIVVGLLGPWGCGKTSIINCAEEHIKNETASQPSSSRPIFVRFNPWNFSDQKDLISQFFRVLSAELRRPDHAATAQKAGKKLLTYAKFFAPFSLLPKVGPWASTIAEVLQKLGSATKDWGDLMAADLHSIKEQLNKLLEGQSQKVIIIIDDIDRLPQNEIRQIFQLVKSLADFCQTVYLLAFDKGVVMRALADVQGAHRDSQGESVNRMGWGEDYIAKIVQIPLDVPVVPEEMLREVLEKAVQELLGLEWKQEDWQRAYRDGLRHLFRNLRDVNRFLNLLRFAYPVAMPDVNPIDFAVLTELQASAPRVYDGIKGNKILFAGVLSDDEEQKKLHIEIIKTHCDEIAARSTAFSKESIVEVLKVAFPKLGGVYGPFDLSDASDLNGWGKSLRLCHPDFFDRYFRLAVENDDFPQSEIEALLALADQASSFREAVLQLTAPRLHKFLVLLHDYHVDRVPDQHVQPMITALFDVSELLSQRGYSEEEALPRIGEIVTRLLRSFDTHEKRLSIAMGAVSGSASSYPPVYVATSWHSEFSKSDDPANIRPEVKLKLFTLDAPQLTELKQLVTERIHDWAQDGRLIKVHNLRSLLYYWKQWGEEAEIESCVEVLAQADADLVLFVTAFFRQRPNIDMTLPENKAIYRNSVAEFLDLKRNEERIRTIIANTNLGEFAGPLARAAFQTLIEGFDLQYKKRHPI